MLIDDPIQNINCSCRCMLCDFVILFEELFCRWFEKFYRWSWDLLLFYCKPNKIYNARTNTHRSKKNYTCYLCIVILSTNSNLDLVWLFNGVQFLSNILSVYWSWKMSVPAKIGVLYYFFSFLFPFRSFRLCAKLCLRQTANTCINTLFCFFFSLFLVKPWICVSWSRHVCVCAAPCIGAESKWEEEEENKTWISLC